MPIVNTHKINFYREFNAKSIANATLVSPNKHLLPELLKEKLADKVSHLQTIYTKTLRDIYLNKKNMLTKAETMPEYVVKTLLATRVAADILEILLAFADLTSTEIDFTNIMAKDLTEQEIYLLFTKQLNEGINLTALASLLKSYLNHYTTNLH